MSKAKIFKLEDLENMGGVHLHGCFDLVHIGHIRHMQKAKALAPDKTLTVTLTADRFITKGEGRPAFTQEVRAEWLASIHCVDYVAIVEERTGVSAINIIKPLIYVKGGEYKEGGVLESERLAVIENGGFVHYTKQDEGISSTKILTGEYLNERRALCKVLA